MKIYCYIGGEWEKTGDLYVCSLGNDGQGLAGHMSSSIDWAKHDIGLTSDWKHDIYKMKYPDGYELEWIDDTKNHKEFQKALELNHKLHKDRESV